MNPDDEEEHHFIESASSIIKRHLEHTDNLYQAAMEHLHIAYTLLEKDLELKGSSELIVEYWAIEKLLNIYTLRQ
ncbi:hypothetical protein [Pedobacter sp. Leaf170]|uniref:hypothetical protein n=1 Tax=Pedobacter sp. Leaf170 TaxID=2876558 RepID=UPI001E56656C|nr:hypothetical protein [Pedobacter sp. Leaf170]